MKILTGNDENDIISQYVTFTHIIYEQLRTYGQTGYAVANAIQICAERNILKEYLNRQRKEVIDIMFTLFDQDEVLRDYMISERREVAEEVARGAAKAMYQDGQLIKKIAQYVQADPKTVEKWLGMIPQT